MDVFFFLENGTRTAEETKKKRLSFSLSLATNNRFYCLTTIISSYGERTVMPNYRDADLIIQNDTQTADSINSLQPALNKNILSELEEIKEIRDIHVLNRCSDHHSISGRQDFLTGGWRLPFNKTICVSYGNRI